MPDILWTSYVVHWLLHLSFRTSLQFLSHKLKPIHFPHLLRIDEDISEIEEGGFPGQLH